MPDQSPQAETKPLCSDALVGIVARSLAELVRSQNPSIRNWYDLAHSDLACDLIPYLEKHGAKYFSTAQSETSERTVNLKLDYETDHATGDVRIVKREPTPDTRVVGDGYAPDTDLPLHATVQFRDGSRVTMWRRGAGWAADPEPRSIDEIAAEHAPADAGELPIGEISSEKLLSDVQWLLSEAQRLQVITGTDDPPPIGQHMDPKWTAVRRIAKGQTVGVSRRYLEAIVRDLSKLPSSRHDPGCFAGGDAGICLHAEAARERADNLSFLIRDTVANCLSAPEILSDTPEAAADKLTAGWDALVGRADADSKKFGIAYLAWRERVLKLNNGNLILPDESQEEYESWLSRAEWGNADDEVTATDTQTKEG